MKYLLSRLIVLVIPIVLASCGSFNLLRNPEKKGEDAGVHEKELESCRNRLSQLLATVENQNLQISEKNRTIQALNDKVRGLERKLELSETRHTDKKRRVRRIQYASPETLYQKARNLLIEGQYQAASAHFSTFINDHHTHRLADNAVYWLGECHYSTGDFQQAIFVFKELTKKYPRSEKVPDALLKIGYSYISLDDANRAHHYLKQVLKRYPFSPASEKAQEKLGEFD